jgi:hypothetical protein
MKFVDLLRGKLVAAALVSIILVGGATAVFAAAPAGQNLVHTMTGSAHATVAPDVDRHANNTRHANTQPAHDPHASNSNTRNCPGLPAAQQLATQFALSSESKSPDIQAMCSLHQGTFKGTTPNGTSVSSKRVFGYGEIDQLLTYAHYLAGQDKAHAGSKLTSANAWSYLAEAIQSCGTTPLDTCLKTNIPGFQPGNHNNANQGNGNGNGRPRSTPTPHH